MLICDKRRPRTRGDTNIRPPQGGRIKTAPPASGPRLGRSSAWGVPPPDPPGLRPLCRLRGTDSPASCSPEGRRSFRPWGGEVRVGNWARSALSKRSGSRRLWARAEGPSCPRGSRRGRESPRRPRRGRVLLRTAYRERSKTPQTRAGARPSRQLWAVERQLWAVERQK